MPLYSGRRRGRGGGVTQKKRTKESQHFYFSYPVKFFLHNGADINYRDARGWTALMHVMEYKKLENVKLLLQCQAEVKKTKLRW